MDGQETQARLRTFEGRWGGHGEVYPNPFGPSGPTRGAWSFRMDPSGHHLIHDYEEERANGTRFYGHGVLSVDPSTHDVAWFWFDSYGWLPVPPARGTFDGNALVLQKTTPRGLGRSVFTLEDSELRYETQFQPADAVAFIRVAEGKFQRAPVAGPLSGPWQPATNAL